MDEKKKSSEIDLDEEEEEEEVFEIVDFSISSPFEKFVAQLENVLRTLHKNKNQKIIQTKNIQFKSLQLTLHFQFTPTPTSNTNTSSFSKTGIVISQTPHVIHSVLNSSDDFPIKSQHIYRWYGLKTYILLYASEDKVTRSQCSMLLSALSLSLNNMGIKNIPYFVHSGYLNDRIYLGRCNLHHAEKKILKFSSEKIREFPPLCNHLAGLLDLFTLNISKYQSLFKKNITVAARFSFDIQRKLNWNKIIHKYNISLPKHLLNWGSVRDPIENIIISCKWKSFGESDGKFQKDKLIPIRGNSNSDEITWRLMCFREPNNDVKLVNFLKYLCDIYKKVVFAKEDLIPHNIENEFEDDEITTIEDSLKTVFAFTPQNELDKEKDNKKKKQRDRKLPKSFPEGSLLSFFAIQASFLDNVNEIKLFWKKFISKLRSHWEKRETLPNIPDPKPEWSDSLLYQKLVMLNCCIDNLAEIVVEEDVVEELSDNESDGEEDESEEEFFDVDESVKVHENEEKDRDGKNDSISGVGRKEVLEGWLLHTYDKEKCDGKIWVPLTKELPPYTQDMLYDQQKMLSKLGNSSKASEIRAKQQSGSLLSDMQAFKAANPLSQFVDFCKWYSPSDVLNKSELSIRMKKSSLWNGLWEKAKAIPVKEQKDELDYEKEGDKVMKFFELIPFQSIVKELLLHLYIIAFYTLDRVKGIDVDFLNEEKMKLKKKLKDLSLVAYPSKEKIREINSAFEKLEILYSMGASLSEKFPNESVMKNIISELCKNMESSVKEDDQRQEVLNSLILKKDDDGEVVYSNPSTREFIFREETGHRMYVVIQKNLFRVASVFVEPFPK